MASTDSPAFFSEEVGMPTPETIDLRCSVVAFRGRSVLLLHRTAPELDDWVLPGTAPRPGEGSPACARRALREQTGLRAAPSRVAFVLEDSDPHGGGRTLELVFAVHEQIGEQRLMQIQHDLVPEFVAFSQLRELTILPALAGHLAGFHYDGARRYAPYLDGPWSAAGRLAA